MHRSNTLRGWALLGLMALVTGGHPSGIPSANAQEGSAESQTSNSETNAVDEELQREVRALVRDLQSRTLADREAAEKDLIALGTKAIKLLPPDSDQLPAETRQRLSRVRDALERQFAEEAAQPTLVTLMAKKPLLDILKDLEQQTENPIIDYRPQFGQQALNPEIEVAFDKVPFWKALDTVLDASTSSTYGFPPKPAVALINRAPGERPRLDRYVSYAGPFRIEATEIESRRELQQERPGVLRLQLETHWEPRLAPIAFEQPLSDVTAEDDQGNAIQISGGGSVGTEVPPGSISTVFDLPFVPPAREASKIASLRGRMHALVPGRIQTFEFTDLSKTPTEKQVADVTVVLERMRKTNAVWQLAIKVKFGKSEGSLQSHRGWILDNEAYLLGPDDKQIPHATLETTMRTEDEIGLAYYYDLEHDLSKYRFVYRTPVAIMQLPVEYEIKDIPLP